MSSTQHRPSKTGNRLSIGSLGNRQFACCRYGLLDGRKGLFQFGNALFANARSSCQRRFIPLGQFVTRVGYDEWFLAQLPALTTPQPMCSQVGPILPRRHQALLRRHRPTPTGTSEAAELLVFKQLLWRNHRAQRKALRDGLHRAMRCGVLPPQQLHGNRRLENHNWLGPAIRIAALTGLGFDQQMVAIQLNAQLQILEATASNALSMTIDVV